MADMPKSLFNFKSIWIPWTLFSRCNLFPRTKLFNITHYSWSSTRSYQDCPTPVECPTPHKKLSRLSYPSWVSHPTQEVIKIILPQLSVPSHTRSYQDCPTPAECPIPHKKLSRLSYPSCVSHPTQQEVIKIVLPQLRVPLNGCRQWCHLRFSIITNANIFEICKTSWWLSHYTGSNCLIITHLVSNYATQLAQPSNWALKTTCHIPLVTHQQCLARGGGWGGVFTSQK